MPSMLAADRPCFVQFKTMAIEDREGSLREGHYVAKEVVFAIVMPPGGQDTVEAIAEEWIEGKKVMGDPHAEVYDRAYRAFVEGHEIPENGTFIKSWPAISADMAEQCIRANVRTVEDLATAPESTLTRIGMGARGLQEKAEIWLTTAANVGVSASKIEALEVRLSDVENELGRKDEIIKKLQAGSQVDGTEGSVARRRPGRPKAAA